MNVRDIRGAQNLPWKAEAVMSGLSRRSLLGCSIALIMPTATAVALEDNQPMTKSLWKQWQTDWRRMEAIAQRRGWSVEHLTVSPPATETEIRAVEARHGLKIPQQLRQLLTGYSRHVEFGWYIPPHLHPLEKQGLPVMSANRSAIWDLAHIDLQAIPNFLGWKETLAERDLAEAPNTPAMWENQFPFYDLVNGDMLTIDMSDPHGPQPVRYFSHELAMLHGMALAPDFLTFVTEMSKLGFAGTEWASWGKFGAWNEEEQTFYIKADSPGGREWLSWLGSEAIQHDEPPAAIVEETPAERQLLDAARSGDMTAAIASLALGARPDVVPASEWLMENIAWNDEFSTPLNYAVQADAVALAQTLLERGATLNTRRLVLGDAVQNASPDMLRWLIDKGARVNGWKDDRFWPLHLLITRRGEVTAPTRAELEARLRKDQGFDMLGTSNPEIIRLMRESKDGLIRDQLARWLPRSAYLDMLRMLLAAGATVDARWDNGTTMLMQAQVDDGAVLLEAGADPNARDDQGSTALHNARDAAKIRLLVRHGADIDALEEPPPTSENVSKWASTPLQSAVLMASLDGLEPAQTLLELNADPHKPDRDGRSTLCYCIRVDSFKLIQGYGLALQERTPSGGTLLHNLFEITSVRAAMPDEVAMLDFLISLGVPVNAVDANGRTMLHIAAGRTETPSDIALLLERGADRTIRDKNGKRAVDLVPRSLKEVRALLL